MRRLVLRAHARMPTWLAPPRSWNARHFFGVAGAGYGYDLSRYYADVRVSVSRATSCA